MSGPLMMTGYLIGVDVGSSDCKALVMDPGGTVIASSAVPYPTRYPRPGWAEQDAHDWYRAACRAIREAMRDLDSREVIALAVDGPAHNVALLDENGNVLYPVIHWSDLRSVPQSESLAAQLGDRVFAITYSQVNPSWTLTQLIWLRKNEPEVWRKLRHILVTKDYVRYR
ncbi:MAG: xylulokinase, partial [Anaerolineae bacterium]|nr:xylulokinase [Anaerolineae bacterium]